MNKYPRIDLNRLVDFQPAPCGRRWRCTEGSKRRGTVGRAIGVIALRHASGYEVVLELDDGSLDTFSPMALVPVLDGG